ncbi:MAG: hypothetical protein L0Y71_05125 [Gemmataceae bacterium]|nr:hypothetical protein [Gemmataceae bacterium]
MLALGLPLGAAEPALRNLNVRGLQINGTTTLVCDGDDFGKAPRLLLPFRAKQVLKPGSTDKQATFDVTLSDEVVPGYHHVRIVTDGGVSLPVVVAVDRLPQRPFTASIDPLPVALHGSVGGSQTLETRFTGKAGQKVMVEVEAQRLGSKLRPILHLNSPKNLQLAWAWGTPALFGDTRLEATLPADGVYSVTLHDAEYAAPAPNFFRLRIGQWAYVDQVFPPAVRIGSKQGLEAIGRSSRAPTDHVESITPGIVPLGFHGIDESGPQPFVIISPHPEVNEQLAPGKLLEIPTRPQGVNGRLSAPFEEDRFKLAVVPLTKIRFDVFAERLGSPIDVALVIRNEKGDQLARAEDGAGTLDPALEYAVPDKVTTVIVGIVDAQGRGGPRGIYRLAIKPQSPAVLYDCKLSTPVQRVTLPLGGRSVIPVVVERRGFQGEIELSPIVFLHDATKAIKFEGTVIPDGADGTLLSLTRNDSPFEAFVSRLRGRDAGDREQPVIVKGHPLERLQPWLATEIAVAPSAAKAADFQVAFGSLPSDAAIVPGNKLKLPINVTRTNPKTVVKLTLLTSQLAPLVNNQPDPNKTIRQEKPVELGDKAASGELDVVVPVELPSPVYDIAVQAELLTPDKKIVLASAVTPVRRLPVRLPLVVSLDGPARIDVALDAKKGATLKVPGKIERRESLKGDVAVTLTGLPPGAKADAVTVKADAIAFTLNVALPPNVPAGEVRGLKLAASAAPDPKQPARRVKSRDVEVTLVVKTAK